MICIIPTELSVNLIRLYQKMKIHKKNAAILSLGAYTKTEILYRVYSISVLV